MSAGQANDRCDSQAKSQGAFPDGGTGERQTCDRGNGCVFHRMNEQDNRTRSTGQGLSAVVERNIAALLERRKRGEQRRTISERVSDAIAAFAGSLRCVYLHITFFGTWLVINGGWTPIKPFDPTFFLLSTVASVEAIFLSTFVLINQNRMGAQADQRSELDLQISLLSEHEITRLIQLVDRLAEKLGNKEGHDAELEELKQDVHPEAVLDQMERQVEN